MALIFEIIYVNDKPTLVRIEEKYGPLNIKVNDHRDDYDPVLDNPELRQLDRLMRQIPRAGGGD